MRVKVHVWKTILTKDHSDSGAQDELGEIVKWLLLRLCCVPCLFCPFLWGNGTLLFRAFNPISKQFRVYVNYSLSQEVRSFLHVLQNADNLFLTCEHFILHFSFFSPHMWHSFPRSVFGKLWQLLENVKKSLLKYNRCTKDRALFKMYKWIFWHLYNHHRNQGNEHIHYPRMFLHEAFLAVFCRKNIFLIREWWSK